MIKHSCKSLKNESNIRLYHLSSRNIDGKTLVPRIPNNEFIKWGVEDGKTKRVCMGRSVGKCLVAIGRNLTGQIMYVYVPDSTIPSDKIMYPTRKQVPDVHLTHEVWVMKNVKLKLVGKIKCIKGTKEHTLELDRKDTGEKYIGHPCEWDYEWLKEDE